MKKPFLPCDNKIYKLQSEDNMSSLLIFLSISIIIFIHELGHYIAARKAKIGVEDFSLGFGPSLWHKKIGENGNETTYHIRAIPLGGYVLPKVTDEKEFFRIPVAKRILFSLGGPAANFLLSLLLYFILYLQTSPVLTAVQESLHVFVLTFQNILQAVPVLFTEPSRLSGIVGIVAMGKEHSMLNSSALLSFSAMISLNLGILNMLPIPALDGGKILLYVLEKIHPALKKLQMPLSLVSWVFLIGLFVYITGLDIQKLVVG